MFRSKLFTLFNFDWVTIPLVYTQVVTLAVYTFFLSCLMGRQFLDNGRGGDVYFPFFTFLQFLFYMGWLKLPTRVILHYVAEKKLEDYLPSYTDSFSLVAETMLNPFGEDDDDFEINHIIDRNLKIAYLIVDEMHAEHPELIKDQYWDTNQFELPYTAAAGPFKTDPLIGSAANIEIPQSQQQFINKMPSLMSLNEEFDTRDENLAFLPSCSLRRPSGQSMPRRQSQLTRNGSKTSLRLGGFLKSLNRNASSRKASTADLESELQAAKDKMNAKMRKGLPNSESFVSSDLANFSPRSNYHEEIFQMSDSDSDLNDNSTTGLLSDKFHPGSHRRSSDGALPINTAGKPSFQRLLSVQERPQPTVTVHHHQSNDPLEHHRQSLRGIPDADTANLDEATLRLRHLDTIVEYPSSPLSHPSLFTQGSISPRSNLLEPPSSMLGALVREQLARDLHGHGTGCPAIRNDDDSCEMKILDLLGRSVHLRNNNGDLAVDTNADGVLTVHR